MRLLTKIAAPSAWPMVLAGSAALFLGSQAQASAVIDFSKSTVATLPKCDTCSQQVNIGFSVNFGGSFSSLYVNNDGVLSFTAPAPLYLGGIPDASTFPTIQNGGPLIAPFWSDVDTTLTGSVGVAQTTIGSYKALAVTWNNVPAYSLANEGNCGRSNSCASPPDY